IRDARGRCLPDAEWSGLAEKNYVITGDDLGLALATITGRTVGNSDLLGAVTGDERRILNSLALCATGDDDMVPLSIIAGDVELEEATLTELEALLRGGGF
ncbi:MAG: hypothetical protein ACXWYE_04575, partial [Actinomycetota bacterium]